MSAAEKWGWVSNGIESTGYASLTEAVANVDPGAAVAYFRASQPTSRIFSERDTFGYRANGIESSGYGSLDEALTAMDEDAAAYLAQRRRDLAS